jgi:hypothetical protein
MAKKYADPVGWVLLDGLKNGRSLLQLLWGTTKFNGPSTLAVYMDTITYRSGEAWPRLATLAFLLNADIPTVRKWLNDPLIKGLFEKDPKGWTWRPLYKGREEIRKRIQADVAVRWILSDITEISVKKDGEIRYVSPDRPAPHSNKQFMEETGRTEPTITRCLDKAAEEDQFIIRVKRHNKGKMSLFIRPDNQFMIEKMEQQYNIVIDQSVRPQRVGESGKAQRRPSARVKANASAKA